MSDFEFFSKDPSWWGKTFASIWGHLDICPLLNQFHLASITYPELSSLTSLRAWGMQKNSIATSPTYLFPLKMTWCQTGCMAFPPYGWIPVRPGSPLWRKWSGNWLPWSPMDPIGLMPWCSSTGTPAMHHSLGRSAWASCQKEAPIVPPAEESAS